MAAIVNTTYPSYNYVSNYSGAHSTIRSAGAVRNTEQYDAVIGLEREGRLGLSKFGFISLPREVLFLQDERNAKIKSTQVESSTKSDMDEGRDLNKVDDHTDPFRKVDAIKARAENPQGKAQPEPAATDDDTASAARAKTEAATKNENAAKAPAQAIESKDQSFASTLKAATGETRSEPSRAERKRENEKTASRPTVIGAPTTVYATIQATTHPPVSNDEGQAPAQPTNVLA